MADRFKLTRAAELESLPIFRNFVAEALSKISVDAQTVYDIQLAVDEACTNVITHGYAQLDPGSVILEIKLSPAAVELTITDFGHPFEPSDAPKPDLESPLEERNVGGLGLFFIYSVMDDVDYQTDEAGNRLYLTKRLRG
jgi:anti-sigma regulatory factor (Ser/Thr protein kinase)